MAKCNACGGDHGMDEPAHPESPAEPSPDEVAAREGAEEIDRAIAEIEALLPPENADGLSFTCTPAELVLPLCGIRVRLEVRPKDLQTPNEGDGLVAVCRLGIVCEKNELQKALRFHDRVKVFGEGLSTSWGFGDEKRSERYRYEDVVGVTWNEVMAHAEYHGVCALAILWAALRRRESAWNSEGAEYVAKAKMLEASGHGWKER